MPPNRTVAVELRALVTNYVAGMQQSGRASKQTAEQVLALSKAESDFRSSIDQATAAVKANGATLDKSTSQGRANQAALDQVATSSRLYRATLVAQGASQETVNAATQEGKTAWLASASAMGMGEAQAKKLSTTLFSATKAVQEHRAELASLSMTLGLVGAGMLLVAGKGVKTFAEFDKQMSAVAATGDDAKASIASLRQEAIELGAATQYSATEAAQGITELLKAGLTADDVLRGGLAGALNLAAAGQMDVASAAEDTATALNQFGLSGDQASHVADLLAKGANTAQGEVSDMAMALAQGGLVAHQTGLSIEETVAALTMFAKAGLIGSDAGTSLKTMLQRLTPQSEEARKKFKDLGISAYDSSGKFVGLVNFAGQLHQQLKDLTPEARNAALSIMFGSDAVRGAAVLYTQGAAGAQALTDAINDQGFAQRQAAELTNNLAGDLERLGGSIDTVFIQSGSGANNVLRQMAQGAESLVDGIGQLPAPLLQVATLLTGSSGIAILGIAGIAKLGNTAMDAASNFKALGLSAKTAKLAVVGVGGAIAIGTLALQMWAQQAADARERSDSLASTLVVLDGKAVTTTATFKEINDQFNNMRSADWGPSVLQMMNAVGVSAADAQQYVLGNADAIKKVQDQVNAYVQHNGLNAAGSGLLIMLNQIKSSTDASIQSTEEKAKADSEAAASASTYTEALAESAATTDDATSSLKDYATQLFASANAALKASGTQIGWEAALDDTAAAIKKTGEAHRLANGQLDLNTAKGRQNQQALNQLAQSSVTYTQSLMEQGASEDRIKDAMERSRSAFVKQAIAAGMSKAAAKELADEYGLIPSDVTTDIKVTGGDRSATKLAIVQAAIADLPAEQKVEVLSEFDKGGIDAANEALRKINGTTATTTIETVYKTKAGTKYQSDGGLLEGMIQRFASGGFGQPQVRPFQGAAGVNWGERGSGPWEAFISGAPQKKDRSIAIWREVGHRLLGSFSAADLVAGFADGGIAEPTWGGKALSYWQDQLHTPLQITQLKIEIRDLKKDLSEKYTKGKNKGQHKLKGLDRTEAIQKLAEAEAELDLALKAQKVNADKLGSIANRLASYEQQKDEQQASQEAAEKAAQQAQDAAERAAQQAADAAAQLASTSASNSASLMAQYMQGSSAQDLIANMAAGAQEITKFQNLLAGLQTAGLNASVTDWLMGKGTSAADLAQQILAGGQSTIDFLNTGVGQLRTAADALGAAQATGNYTPAPVLSAVTLPGYMQSGASGAAVGNTYHSVFQITQSDPYAVAVAVDQQFRYLT